MPVYKSLRERTILVDGSWTGDVHAHYVCTNTFPNSPNRLATLSERHLEFVDIRSLNCLVRFESLSDFSSWPSNATCSNIVSNVPYTVRQTITLLEDTAFKSTVTEEVDLLYSVANGSQFTQDLGATWQVSADVEEWFEVTDPIADTDPQGFPLYGGSASHEDLTGRGIRFFERLKPGGILQVTVNGAIELDHSLVISQAMSEAVGDIFHGIDRRGEIRVKNDSASLTIPALFAGESVSAPYQKSVPDSSFSAQNHFELQITKGLDETGSSYGFSLAEVKRLYQYRASLYCFKQLYPDSLDILLESKKNVQSLLAASPSVLEPLVQTFWSAFARLDGVDQSSEALDELCPVRSWLEPTSLASSEDARDWRLLIRGRAFPVATVTHANDLLDDGSSLDGWTSSGSLSINGGIQVQFGQAGSLTRTFDPPKNSEGHRFLRIRIKPSSLDSQCQIAIGGKSWTFDLTAGIMQNIDLDLCQPGNIATDIGEKTSRYPLDGAGNVTDSHHWGVSEIAEIEFSFEEADTYLVESISLVKLDHANMSFCGAFDSYHLRQVGVSGEVRPYFWSEVDGRVCDLEDSVKDGENLAFLTIDDFLSLLDGISGWDVTGLQPPLDGYHDRTCEAHLLHGGGVIWDGLWQVGVDLDGTSAILKAQSLWDQVEVYGGAGNVWETNGDYGGNTDIATAKLLRGQAWGLALKPFVPESPLEYQLLDSANNLRGSGLVDSLRFAQTGLPFGEGNQMHKVAIEGSETTLFLLQNRMRVRRVLHEEILAGPPSLDWHEDGEHLRAWIEDGFVRIATKGLGSYSSILTQIAANWVSARWSFGGSKQIIMVTEDGGQIEERFSNDQGANWSMASVLATGNKKFPALAIHPDGRRFVYWVSGADVDGVIRDRTGAILSNIVAARSGVDPLGLAVEFLELPNGLTQVELVTIEGGSVVSSLSTDGATFI